MCDCDLQEHTMWNVFCFGKRCSGHEHFRGTHSLYILCRSVTSLIPQYSTTPNVSLYRLQPVLWSGEHCCDTQTNVVITSVFLLLNIYIHIH
jgi:hypothetical protein